MKKCFGYVRVSTVKQGEGVSLEAQRDAIIAFAERSDISITKWFEEKVTAAKSGRPVFNAMLRELRKRRADGVVMHKIDRSARNFADWAKIGELSDAGVDVHFAAENIDFRSRGGRLTADIQAVIAADYIRNLRDETIKGLYGRLKQGIYPFKAPIGYLDNGGGKVKTIDPERGPLVQRALELYAGGQHSIRKLQTELEQMGLRNDGGRPLSKGAVETLLRNPFYAGIIRIGRSGQTFKGIHEPLVSVATYKAIQEVKNGKAGKKVTRHNHTYRGLFRCRRCGWSMIPERQKGHVYYRCQQPDCPSNSIREEALEEAVSTILSQFAFPEDAIVATTARVERWTAKLSNPTDRKALTLRQRKLESRMDGLTDALLDRLIDKDTFNRRKETLLLEQAELQGKLAEADRQTVSPTQVRSFLERIKSLAEHYVFAQPDEKRQIVEIATSNRTVLGKTVYLEPSNWLRAAQDALAVLECAHSRDNSRRTGKLQKEQYDQLVSAIRSKDAEEAMAELEDIRNHTTQFDDSEDSLELAA
ncbi:recombinase family protein [Mesorhizobium sp. Z1-4]|uniref:recombinase family protein n=1 Tax=Mesorhizobium sp. Z1-4 TaxID=2448478 RepID=UPI000FDB7255|nr:recombinase family protein [Mesorhizobium sp. Z1-4]